MCVCVCAMHLSLLYCNHNSSRTHTPQIDKNGKIVVDTGSCALDDVVVVHHPDIFSGRSTAELQTMFSLGIADRASMHAEHRQKYSKPVSMRGEYVQVICKSNGQENFHIWHRPDPLVKEAHRQAEQLHMPARVRDDLLADKDVGLKAARLDDMENGAGIAENNRHHRDVKNNNNNNNNNSDNGDNNNNNNNSNNNNNNNNNDDGTSLPLPNVLVLAMDSVSRAHFHRKLRKTVEVLETMVPPLNHQRAQHMALEFFRYHSVEQAEKVSFLPLLFGPDHHHHNHAHHQAPDAAVNATSLFSTFWRHGFITTMLETSCDIDSPLLRSSLMRSTMDDNDDNDDDSSLGGNNVGLRKDDERRDGGDNTDIAAKNGFDNSSTTATATTANVISANKNSSINHHHRFIDYFVRAPFCHPDNYLAPRPSSSSSKPRPIPIGGPHGVGAHCIAQKFVHQHAFDYVESLWSSDTDGKPHFTVVHLTEVCSLFNFFFFEKKLMKKEENRTAGNKEENAKKF